MSAKAKGELIFSIVLMAYTLSFVVLSFTLESLSRRFPLIVAGVMIIFLIIKIVRILKGAKLFDKEDMHPVSVKEKVITPWREAFPTITWVVGLLLGLYIFGLVLGGILFTFFYVKYWGKQTTAASLLSTFIVTILVYVLFGIIMKFQIYSGILQIKLPFIFNT